MKKHKFKFPFAQITGVALVFLLLTFTALLINSAIVKLPCFLIKEVLSQKVGEGDLSPFRVIDLTYLKGKNIFFVNLPQECRRTLQLYPSCKDVRIIKVIPDRLYVDFIMRKPVAIAKLHRNFYVDDEGVLFDMQAKIKEELCVPQILGLNTRILEAIPGRKYENNNLILALQIIRGLRDIAVLKDWKITKIDVSDNSNTSIILSKPPELANGLKTSSRDKVELIEVKIGGSFIRDNLNILGSLFTHEKENLSNIEYVDLRFKEPVIKFKEL